MRLKNNFKGGRKNEKKLLVVLSAIVMIAAIAPMASADFSISGWGITQYVSTDKKIVGTQSLSEDPYFTNSMVRLIVKGGGKKANVFL